MNTLQMKYKESSALMAGTACAVMMLNHINNLFDRPIPGLNPVGELAQFILFLWVGLLIGSRMKPRRWLTGLIALVTLYLLYLSRHYDYYWQALLPALHLTMLGVGILWPKRMLGHASEEKGWESLPFLLATVFCFTACSVVRDRLLHNAMMPEHRDMEQLMQDLMRNVVPLTAILAGCFAVRFSFSEWGRRLGACPWFRGFVAVPAVMVFIATLVNCSWGIGIAGYLPLLRLLSVLVQPVTIWLIVSAVRRIKKRRELNRPGAG